ADSRRRGRAEPGVSTEAFDFGGVTIIRRTVRSLLRGAIALAALVVVAVVAASCSSVRPPALTVNGSDISRDSIDRELTAIADNPDLKRQISVTEGSIKSGGSSIWLTHVVSQQVVDLEVQRRGITVRAADRRAGPGPAAPLFRPPAVPAVPQGVRPPHPR